MTLWSARCRHRQVEHATVEEDGPTMGNRRNDEVLNPEFSGAMRSSDRSPCRGCKVHRSQMSISCQPLVVPKCCNRSLSGQIAA